MKNKLISIKMKIFLLVLLILSITFYASGCIVLAKSGYKLSNYADEFNTNLNGFHFNFDDFNFSFYESTVSTEQPLNENINNIEFNLISQNIKVKNYDGDSIKIEIKSNALDKHAKLPCTEQDNKLIFNTTSNSSSDFTALISIPNSYKGNVQITTSNGNVDISNFSSKSSSISTASGDISMSGITLNYLSLNTSNGYINLNNIDCLEESKFNSKSGDIKLYGNFGVLNGQSKSGDINLQVKDALKNISLNALSGDISLSLPPDSGYKINCNTSSGDIISSNNSFSSGDESSIIDLKTASGDIHIN